MPERKPVARSLKFQELSIKNNNYHSFQTEKSRTISWDSVKYSGLFKIQHYWYIVLFYACELNTVYQYIYISVLWYNFMCNLTLLLRLLYCS